MKTYDRRLLAAWGEFGAFVLLPPRAFSEDGFLGTIMCARPANDLNAADLKPAYKVLALAFKTAESRDKCVASGVIVNETLTIPCVVPPTTTPTLATYHVERMPPWSAVHCVTWLRGILKQCGTVHEIRPRYWADTTILTPTWQVTMELGFADALVPGCIVPALDFNVGKSDQYRITADPVLVERKGQHSMCRYCMALTHTKLDCRQRRDIEDRRRQRQVKAEGS
jgi:hypothetical protein